jgi:hypothetical protein
MFLALAPLAVVAAQQPANPELARGEARQVPDTAFVKSLGLKPTFTGAKPVVALDEAHANFHTVAGRYRAFAQLLTADGIDMRSNTQRFDAKALGALRVLVIANALNPAQTRNTDWKLPSASAFDSAEIAAVAKWVRDGGSILLIADHMPFAGAASSLALALGIHFANGFALPPVPPDPRTGDYVIEFRRADGSLGKHKVTTGIDSIASFTGSAFWVDSDLMPATLMHLPAGTRVKLPAESWKFSESTAELPGDWMAQGAVFRLGKGRVAVFGEAAMFSAQLKGPDAITMGMNNPVARQNPRFVLNVVHWLLDQ